MKFIQLSVRSKSFVSHKNQVQDVKFHGNSSRRGKSISLFYCLVNKKTTTLLRLRESNLVKKIRTRTSRALVIAVVARVWRVVKDTYFINLVFLLCKDLSLVIQPFILLNSNVIRAQLLITFTL